jgi:hypothetical protein
MEPLPFLIRLIHGCLLGRGNYSWNISDSQRDISAFSAPSLAANGVNGRILKNTYENSSTYGDALLIGSPKISESISLDFTVGEVSIQQEIK